MQLLADLFPSEVTLPGAVVVRRARTLVTDEGVVVLVEEAGSAKIRHRDRHTAPPMLPQPGRRVNARALVHGVDGDVIIRQLGGCRCQSILRRVTLEELESL